MRFGLMLIALGTVLGGCLSDEESVEEASTDITDNTSPEISGSPQSAVTINDTYTFEPSASDSDGDQLTFEVSNKPSWAAFNASTGRLSGRPTLGDIGTYDQIQIVVSDGIDSTTLRAFSIVVAQSALGSVTLSWNAPDQNEDGTALMDLSGYKIYYGNSSRNYDREITIDNVGLTTYVVEQLVPGTYYFAATALNSTGIESSYSGEAVRMVN